MKFDCGKDAAHMEEDCDVSASGNGKGRKRGNIDLHGNVVCKWKLNMYLIWTKYNCSHIWTSGRSP